MRILLVTPMPPRAEALGAIPLLLHAQLTALQMHHDVTLVTVAGDEPGERDAVAELVRSGVDVRSVDRRVDGARMRRQRRRRLAGAWLRGRHPWRTVWFAEPRVQDAIDDLTTARQFDVASVEDNSMGTFRFPAHLPRVLTEYEVRRPRPIDWRCGRPGRWPGWAFREADWRRWPAYQRSVWQRFDRVSVFTDEDAVTIAELAPGVSDRVRVTPFGIDVPRPADPGRERPGTLLFVGNFTHPPNVDAAVWLVSEVLPRLRAGAPQAHLLLVGNDGAERVGHLAASDVEVVGAADEIGPYLDAASVVLAPVRTGGGMRVKVLQALAAGKAVVTTSRGARGLMFGDGEPPLEIADDAEGIAAAAGRLLQDEPLRRSLGERARRFAVERHSGAAYACRLEAVYAEAVALRRADAAG